MKRRWRGARPWCCPGSLPPGLPPGHYAELTGAAAAAGVPVLLDTHGEALRRGAAAGPAIVKPNLAELAALAGRLPARRWPRRAAADQAVARGRAASCGRRGPRRWWSRSARTGCGPSTGDGSWRAVPPAAVAGNPTGAGDAVAAGLVHGLVLGRPWEERLRHAVGARPAAAAAPRSAGEFRRPTTSARWPR